jgi:hypothetical protein
MRRVLITDGIAVKLLTYEELPMDSQISAINDALNHKAKDLLDISKRENIIRRMINEKWEFYTDGDRYFA